jgi:hypothetical protein
VIVPLTALLIFALPFGAFRSIAHVLPVPGQGDSSAERVAALAQGDALH